MCKYGRTVLTFLPSSLFQKVDIQQHLICVQDATQWSRQLASLMHEAWYSWHASLWQNRLCLLLPTTGPGLLHSACRSRLAADVVAAPSTPIVHHQAKALQLQLLVRHMARCVFESFDLALLIVYRNAHACSFHALMEVAQGLCRHWCW